jgi:activator of HSP90 ATPase
MAQQVKKSSDLQARMKTKTIRQTVMFNASPKQVYDMLMDAATHSAITQSKVTMSAKVRGKFSVFDGYCHGYHIELVQGKKIVQAWHFEEDGWPEDHFSICTFSFKPIGSKTKLTFEQREIPAHKASALSAGWKKYYWTPIKKLLNG